ncbi:MAG: response regulator [Deltaproteobacteria bacterium]|nr:response regulator [Deltaproteobacteria bacterium]
MKYSFQVLVVDDERDFLEPLVVRLCRRGLQAQGVTSGEAALAHLAAQPVDVVVLDVKMPGMDGIQALREIKARYPDVEVVMLTGHASVEAGMEGLKLGAFDYLIKPVKIDKLVEILEQAYERRQVVQEG